MNLMNSVLAESTAFQADRIQPISACVTRSGGLGKRKNIASDGGPAANKRMRANANKVMDRAKRTHRGPLFHGDVTTKSRRIGQDYMVADHAIVSDVGVSHDQNMVAQAGESSTFDRATIDGDELADGIVTANFQTRRFAGVG